MLRELILLAAGVLEPLDWPVVPPRMGSEHLSDLLQNDSGKMRSAERTPELRCQILLDTWQGGGDAKGTSRSG